MIHRARFDGEVQFPTDQRMQYFHEPTDRLPRDGLPRITMEGLAILTEGLRGDFSRWRWSIGNHPLEVPAEHVSNIQIRAMKDEPHFIARFWYGPAFPQVNYAVLAPDYIFDEVDTMTLGEDDPERIYLRQEADPWAHCPVMIEDNMLWTERDRSRFARAEPAGAPQSDEEDEDEAQEGAPAQMPAQGTLDAWMEEGSA